jgi:hypothetical protein
VSDSTPFDAVKVGQLSGVKVGAVMTKVGVTVPVNGPDAVHTVPPDGAEIRIVPVIRPSVTNSLASVPVKLPDRSAVLLHVPLTLVPLWVTEPERIASLTGVTPAVSENVPLHWPLSSMRVGEGVGAGEELPPQEALRHAARTTQQRMASRSLRREPV